MLIKLIDGLINHFNDIRYIAIYKNNELISKQREYNEDSSAGETDKYEELLVNPTLLKVASQRGNIDCGGLHYLLLRYGNFFQFVKEINGGHISICLKKECNLNSIPNEIITYLDESIHL